MEVIELEQLCETDKVSNETPITSHRTLKVKAVTVGATFIILTLSILGLIYSFASPSFERYYSPPKTVWAYSPSSSFHKFSPRPDAKHKVIPAARNNKVRYMGTNTWICSDFNAAKTVRAILGDEYVRFVEPYLFERVKLELMHDEKGIEELEQREGVSTKRKLMGQFDTQLVLEGLDMPTIPDAAEAAVVTAELIDKYEMKKMKSEDFINTTLWYQSGYFIENPTDMIWSTLFQVLATHYGSGVLVIDAEKEKKRSMDLNYYNYHKDGLINDSRRQIGLAEFITPGFLEGDQVLGYHVYKETTNTMPTFWPIEYAVYKVVYDSKPYVVVLDGLMNNGSQTLCIVKVNDEFHFCDHRWKYTNTPPYPRPLEEKPAVIGIIGTCEQPDFQSSKSLEDYCTPPPAELVRRYTSNHPTSITPKRVISELHLEQKTSIMMYFAPMSNPTKLEVFW